MTVSRCWLQTTNVRLELERLEQYMQLLAKYKFFREFSVLKSIIGYDS